MIAKIYCNKLFKRKEALEILKEGVENVGAGKQKQEIEYMISKIEQEEDDLFTGVITMDDLYNGSNIEYNKKSEEEEEENNMNKSGNATSSVVMQSKNSEDVISEKKEEENVKIEEEN